MEKLVLTPISEKEFRKVVRGSGIRYRNKIPSSELKAMLGFKPIEKKKPVEMREDGEFESFESMTEAGREFGITAASIKYALDHGREFIKRRKDGKSCLSDSATGDKTKKKYFFCERYKNKNKKSFLA